MLFELLLGVRKYKAKQKEFNCENCTAAPRLLVELELLGFQSKGRLLGKSLLSDSSELGH